MRVILVPLGGDRHDPSALAAAYAVARPFRSHIEGLFVRPELIDAIAKHREWGASSGEAQKRSVDAMRSEVKVLLRERVLRNLERTLDERGLEEIVARVADKSLDPYGAVDALLGHTKSGSHD